MNSRADITIAAESPGSADGLTAVRRYLDDIISRYFGRRATDGEIERAALDAGLTRLRLGTRSDLVEARRLYTRAGYSEAERFNDSPYAQHWFAKSLHPSP